MAFTYSTAIQSQIAIAVWGLQNSALSTEQRIALDGTWTSGANPTVGAAGYAITTVGQVANYYEMAGATSAPQVWERWVVIEAALQLIPPNRPDRYQQLKDEREVAIDALLDTFTLRDPTGSFASTNDSQLITVQGIRYYVLNACARRRQASVNTGMRRRLFPPTDMVDAAIQWTLNYVYNKDLWSFRKREVTLVIGFSDDCTGATWTESSKTLTQTGAFASLTTALAPYARFYVTDGTGVIVGDYQVASKTSDNAIVLTASIATDGGNLSSGDITGYLAWVDVRGLLTGEQFGAPATRRFSYTSNADYGAYIRWADSTDIERAKAELGAAGRTSGRPDRYRIETQPQTSAVPTGVQTWHLVPFPSQAYTLRGSVWVKGPGTPSSATDTTVFQRFPPEWGTVIRDMVLAKVLKDFAASDWESVWQRAVEQVEAIAPNYIDQGAGARNAAAADDVYSDVQRLLGSWGPDAYRYSGEMM